MINSREVIKLLKQEKTDILVYKAIDGITIECYLPETEKFDLKQQTKAIKAILEKLNLPSALVEAHKEKQNVFIIQFPEMKPEYTQEEIDEVITNNINALIENLKDNMAITKSAINKQLIEKSKGLLVREAINMYYKGYTNQYKESIDDYTTNTEFMDNCMNLFDRWLSNYEEEK